MGAVVEYHLHFSRRLSSDVRHDMRDRMNRLLLLDYNIFRILERFVD